MGSMCLRSLHFYSISFSPIFINDDGFISDNPPSDTYHNKGV